MAWYYRHTAKGDLSSCVSRISIETASVCWSIPPETLSMRCFVCSFRVVDCFVFMLGHDGTCEIRPGGLKKKPCAFSLCKGPSHIFLCRPGALQTDAKKNKS